MPASARRRPGRLFRADDLDLAEVQFAHARLDLGAVAHDYPGQLFRLDELAGGCQFFRGKGAHVLPEVVVVLRRAVDAHEAGGRVDEALQRFEAAGQARDLAAHHAVEFLPGDRALAGHTADL